jgi:hypothetical protein
MTPEEHKLRHIELHQRMDELIADFINHTGKYPSSTPILELMQWSNIQQDNPEDGRHAAPKKASSYPLYETLQEEILGIFSKRGRIVDEISVGKGATEYIIKIQNGRDPMPNGLKTFHAIMDRADGTKTEAQIAQEVAGLLGFQDTQIMEEITKMLKEGEIWEKEGKLHRT